MSMSPARSTKGGGRVARQSSGAWSGCSLLRFKRPIRTCMSRQAAARLASRCIARRWFEKKATGSLK